MVKRKSAPPTSSVRLVVPVAVTVALAVAAGLWLSRRGPARLEPPGIPAGVDVDPKVERRIRELTATVQGSPGDAAAWVRLGSAFQVNAMPQPALTCLEHAVALDPKSPRAWYHLGTTRMLVSDAKGAIDAYAHAADLAPSFAGAAWRAGYLHLEGGDIAAARSWFQRATKADDADPAGWVGLARAAIQAGANDEAIRILEAQVARNPRSAYVEFLLGTALRQAGRMDEAAAHLARGKATKAEYHDAWEAAALADQVSTLGIISQADVAAAAGDAEAAIAMLAPLHAESPLEEPIAVNLGSAQADVGEYEAAIRTIEAFLAERPGPGRPQAVGHANLARAYRSLGDAQEALDHAERAVAMDANLTIAYLERGRALQGLGRLEEAAASFEAGLEKTPTDHGSLLALAELRLLQGRPAESQSTYRRAIASEPLAPEAHLGLALACERGADFDGAAAALRRAAELGAVSPVMLEQELSRLARAGAAPARR